MAARGISSVKSHNFLLRFTMALASAVLEWLLISMLFIDAIFSYLVTKFARYCKLQVPCLLCSRLDHVLGNEKLGFYWDLICGDHKFEISSFVLCRVHNKLADVHGMCESCLFSFATINKSNSETYRLLVGKFGADSHLGLKDHKLGSPRTRNCSCCNEPWILRGNAQNLLQTLSIGSEVAELEVPLSVATELWDGLKKIREEPSGSLRAYHMGKNGFDPLSNIEYTKVKITSDTESEVPFSDDDDSSALIRETADLKEESAVQHVEMQPRKNDFDPLSHIEYTKVKITSDTESEVPFSDDDDGVALIREASDLKEQSSVQPVQIEPQIISLEDNLTSEKLTHPDSAPELSTVDSQVQLNVIDSQCNTSVASTAATGHGLEELNWSQVEHKVDAFASVDEVPQSSNVTDTLVEESIVCLDTLGTHEVEQKSVTESGEVVEAESRPVTKSETTSEIYPVINGTNSLMPNNLDLCDAYKFAVKGRQLSGKLSEQMSLKDGRLSEDLKLLLSQISVTRGIELSLNDMSPRVSGNRNEPKTDSSSSIGIQMLQRRISLERNESGLSLDGSVISEIEGESEIDRLKRQVEHDKKLLSALYKELEEERNASAISANQAMAMITRLQEEKAALNMEALQCVRMMEEQAEYDEEALQKANDFLAEREKEIQDLEAELELYRNKVGNTSILENELDSTCDLKPGEVRAEHSDTSYFKNSANEQTNNKPLVCNKVDGTGVLFGEKHTNNACNSLLEFDDERLYILHCLKKLEKKLHLFSNDGIYFDKANGEYSGTKGDRVSDLKELNCKRCTQENSEKEENDLSMQKHVSVSVPSFENPEFVSKVSSEFDSGVQCYSGGCRLTDVVALGDAVSNLISRLEALEADHNSFDHFSKSLRMGDDEIKIHSGDILSHVRELWKKSNFELMRPLSEDRKRFWEVKLRTEIEKIKLRKKAREIDLETLQSQHNKLEAELAGARIRVRQACIVAGNKLQLDKNRLASELELSQGLLFALYGNVRWQQNASQAWVNLSGVDSLCFMNSFDNIEEAKLVCTELDYLRHSYFPQRTLITNINGKSFVGFVIHGVSIANFLQKERNRFFDEWDEVKVQPSDFYIQIIRALIDGVYLMKGKDIVAMIDQNHVFIEEDNENNPRISFVKYSKRKSKESEESIQDLQFVNKLICMINESLGVSEDLMDPFLKKLDQFNRLEGDFNTLCEDPILMTSKDKIEFVCELSCIFEAKKWMVLDQCNDDGFDNFEDIVSKDARLNFLKHVLRVFVDTNHPNNRERNNDDANSNMAFRVRFIRNSYVHFWRIVLHFGAEALGFRSLKELQLLFERHFPRTIRRLQLVYKNLKSQLAGKSFKIFKFDHHIEVLADEGLQASKLTLKLLCEKVDKTEAARQNLYILLKSEIKEEKVSNREIFGGGRHREEVLQERESKSPGACRMREQLHGGRPYTWLETCVLGIMQHLEESYISATKAEQESILRKLRIWKVELDKLIVQTNGSFRYC